MSKLTTKRLLNDANKQLKKKRKELRLTKIQLDSLKKRKSEVERLQTEIESVTPKNEGVPGVIKMKQDVPDWINGIWIVAKNDGTMIEMYKFFEYIREIHDYKKLDFEKPKQAFGSDGKEVTFNKGDLLLVSHLGDLKDKRIGFHFANVGPSDERGQLQLELALHRLGMGSQPCSDKSFLVVDGNFRKVN